MEEPIEKKSLSGWGGIFSSSLVIFFLVLTYSVVRYHVFKGVELQHFPLFILNKAVSLASVVFIGLSYLLGPLARFFPYFSRKVHLRKHFGLAGFGLASIHVLMSIMLFNPNYYPKFFDDGKLSLVGELSMAFGILAFFIFAIVAIISFNSVIRVMDRDSWKATQRTGYIAYILVMLHVLTMGLKGWLQPDHWPGGLLPISLVAFIAISIVLLARLLVIALPRNQQNHNASR